MCLYHRFCIIHPCEVILKCNICECLSVNCRYIFRNCINRYGFVNMKFFYCFQPCILIRPSNTCLYIVCACRLRNYCSIFAIFFRTICVYYLSILSRCKRHARFLTVCPVRNTELLCPRIYCRTVRVCPKTADRTLIADSIKYCVKLICIVSSRLQNGGGSGQS